MVERDRVVRSVNVISSSYSSLTDEMRNQIFRFRKSVFVDRRGWDISSYKGGEVEVDEYDDDESYYVCAVDEDAIAGCVRLRSSVSPNLLSGYFREVKAAAGHAVVDESKFWEASRFFITPSEGMKMRGNKGVDRRTIALFLGMIDFGLEKGVEGYEVVVDALMDRLLRRVGWRISTLGSSDGTLGERIYYGLLPCNEESYVRISKAW